MQKINLHCTIQKLDDGIGPRSCYSLFSIAKDD